jgi:hypothetical protein
VRVRLGSALTVPIRSWLVEESGQRGKLWGARQLIDSVRGHVKEVRLLIDAWFMRKRLILPLLEQRVRIIGQVRRDTALFLPPKPEPKRRGRKRKYGQRIDAALLDTLPMVEMELTLYGKTQSVRIRSAIAVARFLKGLPARAVVEIYAERWGIEPLFHNLKRWWGVTNLWQQSKQALELWASFPLLAIAPWRKGAMITVGLFGQWLRIQFIGLRVRNACDPKSGQFVMPLFGQDQRLQC